MAEFNNRVYGAAVVKAVNSNYNADFSGQPRTLPNGVVYATDKAYKYTCKNYMKDVFSGEKIFYFKSLNANLNPLSLDETYKKYFGEFPKKGKDVIKSEVAKNLLSCLDIRLFGATFAGEANISLHGPVQVNHGVNIWKENNIYTEQITSPFSNKSNDPEVEKGMTTIGRQSKLEEGHYLHHFSINPGNLKDIIAVAADGAQKLTEEDIEKLKEAMRRGATWYDSASKAGCENEMLVWVQLNENSKNVLPNFTTLIDLKDEKKEGKYVYDFTKLKAELDKLSSDIKSVEVYYNKQTILLENLPNKTQENDL
ncbi:MAG: type I CRISPR-associated protein Cas7 [Paludibacteraceae bacterium]|nr:type I CRISPR-associated protein Cas7 [Paludibacteraceae bacterium]HOI27214.1 type I CRISPR-associated protein Cas7 [Paludibacteraceae bacterium]HOU67375.1 type I CRISPR-associated protein Cas7 [Paludibacteraceae bacterium]HPH62424.1 type I CRISPR-associated protein Cas7 [Paludibacteraceae bacterium]HQF49521.1 type I CRISPR-associated protein Cas7 [Paludibacteraceae bacterium]